VLAAPAACFWLALLQKNSVAVAYVKRGKGEIRLNGEQQQERVPGSGSSGRCGVSSGGFVLDFWSCSRVQQAEGQLLHGKLTGRAAHDIRGSK